MNQSTKILALSYFYQYFISIAEKKVLLKKIIDFK